MSQFALKPTHEYWFNFLISRLGATNKRIIFTDSSDPRVLKACEVLLKLTTLKPILIGDPSIIVSQAKDLKLNLQGADYMHYNQPIHHDKWTQFLSSSNKLANQKDNYLEDPLAFSAFLLRQGLGQGLVAGATIPTGDVIRCLLSILGLHPNSQWVTSSFLMIHPHSDFGSRGLAVFTDCAVIPEPTQDQLFEITLRAQRFMNKLFLEIPRIALLSFSTSGSSTHPVASKMRELKYRLKVHDPFMEVEGEIQFDAAVNKVIRAQKGINTSMSEDANVFVFPNLESGNIGYKIMQHTSQSLALGPFLEGFSVPISDLSRGCTVEDIVLTALVVACQD